MRFPRVVLGGAASRPGALSPPAFAEPEPRLAGWPPGPAACRRPPREPRRCRRRRPPSSAGVRLVLLVPRLPARLPSRGRAPPVRAPRLPRAGPGPRSVPRRRAPEAARGGVACGPPGVRPPARPSTSAVHAAVAGRARAAGPGRVRLAAGRGCEGPGAVGPGLARGAVPRPHAPPSFPAWRGGEGRRLRSPRARARRRFPAPGARPAPTARTRERRRRPRRPAAARAAPSSVSGSPRSYLVDPASSICLSQRLSHACLSTHGRYSETANGSLNQLWFLWSLAPLLLG